MEMAFEHALRTKEGYIYICLYIDVEPVDVYIFIMLEPIDVERSVDVYISLYIYIYVYTSLGCGSIKVRCKFEQPLEQRDFFKSMGISGRSSMDIHGGFVSLHVDL